MSIDALTSLELVGTKLFLPPLSPTLLPRPRIIHRLNDALAYKITLLSSPAGSGKTTLLREWVSQSTRSVAWLSLAESDNDPVRFWSYIVAACQLVHSSVGKRAMLQLQSLEPSSLDTFLTLFINDLASVHEPFTLILDDYHTITSSTIHHSLRIFLDLLPPSLHLILACRVNPPIALARRRARGELTELSLNDVCFSLEETSAWFTQVLHLPLSSAQLATLHRRTEGWPSALQLAALFLQCSSDLDTALSDFTGSHRYIMDYFLDEVLSLQSSEVRSFLLHTAWLDRLCGSLCDALTDRDDGQAMLEVLEQTNMFLLPLDGQRHWYRYHQLFAEALQVRAQRELLPEMHAILSQRASRWYEQHGLLFESVEMALSAADYDTAIRVGTGVVTRLLFTGQHATVAHWFEQLPPSLLSSRPLLYLALAWTRVLLGQRASALQSLHEAEQCFSQAHNFHGLGQIAAIRAFLARLGCDGQAAIRWGQEALALLSDDALTQRCISVIALAYGYRLQGEIILSRQALSEARLLSEQTNSKSGLLGTTLLQGELLALEGQLHQAAPYFQQVIDAGETWLSQAIDARLALATLLLEWNDLEVAANQIDHSFRLSHQYEDTSFIARTSLLQARVLQAQGKNTQTEDAFWRAVVLAQQSKHPHLLATARAFQARYWLAQGNLHAVREFQETHTFTSAPSYQHEEVALTLVRILLAQGEIALATQHLAQLQTFASAQGRVASQVEILLLTALALDAQALIPDALLQLHQALLLAETGRYCQLFLLEGPTLWRLLHLLQPRWRGKSAATYLDYLLKALPSAHLQPTPSSSTTYTPLLSPLTPREYKVLRLLSAGLSTREISNELVVSLNTIKTQLQSLYRKLNATSRDEALLTARSWQLL
jgi:LuxR family maltose regulon positive regulatory protein